ncbi:rcc01693 family protein [Acidimangrovimonas pyrenivorans]|uniref:Rcc01693 family protein n=1 Tax=Acidimangrovimonas pyrenivorans TaxID=2030798 RepID=A0ABV7AGG3_9RHOB
MSGFDWPGLMRAGLSRRALGGLGLTPEAFWRLTPGELRLMLGAEAAAPLGRAGLEALAREFPDRAPGGAKGGTDGDGD